MYSSILLYFNYICNTLPIKADIFHQLNEKIHHLPIINVKFSYNKYPKLI